MKTVRPLILRSKLKFSLVAQINCLYKWGEGDKISRKFILCDHYTIIIVMSGIGNTGERTHNCLN